MYTKSFTAAMLAVAALAVAPALGSATSTPRCEASSLRLEYVRTLGAASARDADFVLRNVGPQTCHLKGYPGVGLLNSHARLMSVKVDRAKQFKPAIVVLHAWQRAFFTLHYESNAPCAAGIFPTGLQVIPPDSRQGLRISHPVGVCAGQRPDVTPVRAKLGGI